MELHWIDVGRKIERSQEILNNRRKLNDINIVRGLYESTWHMVIVHSDFFGLLESE